MMLTINIVGIRKITDYVLHEISKINDDVNAINLISSGTLGNFKTVTYGIDIPESKFMITRRAILNELSKPGSPVKCLYEHGSIVNVYIFAKTSFRISDQD